MNFSFFIAKRYLSTSSFKNAVSIISSISLLGISIGTAALVIVMSVFNGFESVILDKYNSFDPHIKIVPFAGKTFNLNDANEILLHQKNVERYSNVLEEYVSLQYDNNNTFATIKGVDSNYKLLNNFEELLISMSDSYGNEIKSMYFDESNPIPIPSGEIIYPCNIGAILAKNSEIPLNKEPLDCFKILIPNRESTYLQGTSDMVLSYFKPVGFFSAHKDYDNKYIISSLKSVQKMLYLEESQVSSIEIMLDDESRIQEVKDQLQNKLGKKYIVKGRLEQHDVLYKILNSEKLVAFIILTFILIIASFNIVSAISMLMIEKQKDIKVFWHLGSSKRQIQNIFFIKGFLGVVIGSLIGVAIGIIFALLQKEFGLISMDGNTIVQAYPVKINHQDIIAVEAIVLIIGLISTYLPARVLSKRFLYSD